MDVADFAVLVGAPSREKDVALHRWVRAARRAAAAAGARGCPDGGWQWNDESPATRNAWMETADTACGKGAHAARTSRMAGGAGSEVQDT